MMRKAPLSFTISVSVFILAAAFLPTAVFNPGWVSAAPPPERAWGPNTPVNDNLKTGNHDQAVIAVDASGTLHVIWAERISDAEGYNIRFAYRLPGGAWSAPERVNDSVGNGAGSPSIAVDGAGNAYAVWEDWRNPDDSGSNQFDIYFSYRPAGGSWAPNVRVNDDVGGAWQVFPRIAVDAAGNGYAIWEDFRDGRDDVYFAYRPAGGSWGANAKVNDDTVTTTHQPGSIAADSAGNAYAVWIDGRTGGEFADIYFAFRPSGGDWGPNVKVNDVDGIENQNPSIAVDASGTSYVVWEDMRYGPNDRDICFSSRTAGGAWSPSDRVNDDPGGAIQMAPSIAVDQAGNAHAVWQDRRWGQLAVYSSYRPAGGGWEENRRVSVSPLTYEDRPSVALGPDGTAHAVWTVTPRPATAFAPRDIYSASSTFNLLANGSFEHGGQQAEYWLEKNITIFEGRTTLRAADGVSSYRIRGIAAGSLANKSAYQLLPAFGSAGDLFVLSGWSRAVNPSPYGKYHLTATLYYTDGSEGRFRIPFGIDPGSWRFKQKEIVAAKDYDLVKVSITYSHQTGAAWFDGIKLVRP